MLNSQFIVQKFKRKERKHPTFDLSLNLGFSLVVTMQLYGAAKAFGATFLKEINVSLLSHFYKRFAN